MKCDSHSHFMIQAFFPSFGQNLKHDLCHEVWITFTCDWMNLATPHHDLPSSLGIECLEAKYVIYIMYTNFSIVHWYLCIYIYVVPCIVVTVWCLVFLLYVQAKVFRAIHISNSYWPSHQVVSVLLEKSMHIIMHNYVCTRGFVSQEIWDCFAGIYSTDLHTPSKMSVYILLLST